MRIRILKYIHIPKRACLLNQPVLLVLLIQLFILPAKASDFDQYFLYQTSGIIGDQNIYITENGIKIENQSSDLVTIAKAPSWSVTTFHKKTKTACTLPLAKFNGYISQKEFDLTGQNWFKIPFVKSSSKKIAGLDSEIYITPSTFINKQLKDFDRQFADSKFIKSARYCVSKDIKINPNARQALCKFYGLADKGGLPLEFKYHDLRGDLHIGLITSKTNSVTDFNTSFEVPSGLKQVKTHQELLKIANSTKKKIKRRRPLL